MVKKWDDMEEVWEHTFRMMGPNSTESPLLLAEAPLTPKWHREKLIQIMFETFNFPSVCLTNQGVLSLLASGRTTGNLKKRVKKRVK